MVRIDGFFEELEEGLELGRIGLVHLRVEDARVGANLAEPEELVKGRHADGVILGPTHFHVEDFLTGRFLHLVVELLLVLFEVAVENLFNLRRELGGDGELGAAEDVRCRHLEQTVVVPLTVFGREAFLWLG